MNKSMKPSKEYIYFIKPKVFSLKIICAYQFENITFRLVLISKSKKPENHEHFFI